MIQWCEDCNHNYNHYDDWPNDYCDECIKESRPGEIPTKYEQESEEPEDTVNRKDVIDLYKRGAEIIAKAKGISVKDLPHRGLNVLMNLPSVTPKRKNNTYD